MFDLTDPAGNPVRCSTSSWTDKILANHPELEGREADVRRAVTDPDWILEDRDYPDRRHSIRRLFRRRFFIDVVIEYEYADGTLTGRIVTAFVRERLRQGDTVLYARPKKK